MNTYLKSREPFTFWLVRHFLAAEENQNKDNRPVSNRELFSIFGMIIAALIILKILFQG